MRVSSTDSHGTASGTGSSCFVGRHCRLSTNTFDRHSGEPGPRRKRPRRARVHRDPARYHDRRLGSDHGARAQGRRDHRHPRRHAKPDWCVAGEIVDAESGRLKGESAVHRILALQQGDVVAEFCAVSRTPSFRTSISGLLLEGARRLDECAVLRKSLGTGALILGSSAMAVGASLQPHEAKILRRLDEARCIEDVLSESELGDLETLSAISQLLKKRSPADGE